MSFPLARADPSYGRKNSFEFFFHALSDEPIISRLLRWCFCSHICIWVRPFEVKSVPTNNKVLSSNRCCFDDTPVIIHYGNACGDSGIESEDWHDSFGGNRRRGERGPGRGA